MKMRLYFDPCTDICVGVEALESGRIDSGTPSKGSVSLERNEQRWLPNVNLTIGREFDLDFYPLGLDIQDLLQLQKGGDHAEETNQCEFFEK